jgi:hypothetical protein
MRLKIFLINLGNVISKLTNPIILGLIYLVMFAPVGLIYKILKKDPLNLNKKHNQPSYWKKREKIVQNMRREF